MTVYLAMLYNDVRRSRNVDSACNSFMFQLYKLWVVGNKIVELLELQ